MTTNEREPVDESRSSLTTAVAEAREALIDASAPWDRQDPDWFAALDAFEAAIRAERESPQGRCKARVERPYGYSQCVLAEHSEDWAHIVTGDMELWMAEVWDNPGPTHLARRERPTQADALRAAQRVLDCWDEFSDQPNVADCLSEWMESLRVALGVASSGQPSREPTGGSRPAGTDVAEARG